MAKREVRKIIDFCVFIPMEVFKNQEDCPIYLALKDHSILTNQQCLEEIFFKLCFNPFAPGDFAGKHVLKLVEWFSGHCRVIKG